MFKKIVLSILIMIPFITFANDIDKVKRAVDKLKNRDVEFKYDYSVETIEDNERILLEAVFDPLKTPSHNLLKVDGKTPTKKDIEEFYKELEEEDSSDEEFADLLDGDYRYITTDGDLSCYSYTAAMEILPEKKSEFNCKIWINDKTEDVVRIELRNQKKIKIQLGVSLNRFVMEMDFKKFNNEVSVLDKMEMIIEGKAVVIDFNMKTINKMYNYELIN